MSRCNNILSCPISAEAVLENEASDALTGSRRELLGYKKCMWRGKWYKHGKWYKYSSSSWWMCCNGSWKKYGMYMPSERC